MFTHKTVSAITYTFANEIYVNIFDLDYSLNNVKSLYFVGHETISKQNISAH